MIYVLYKSFKPMKISLPKEKLKPRKHHITNTKKEKEKEHQEGVKACWT